MTHNNDKYNLFSSTFFVGWLVYIVWSAVTGQGLCGYIQSWQFSLMEASYPKLTIVIGIIPGLLLFPIGRLLDKATGDKLQVSGPVALALFFLSFPVFGFMGWRYLESSYTHERELVLQPLQFENEAPVSLKNPDDLNLVRIKGAYIVPAMYLVTSGDSDWGTFYCPFVSESFQGEELQFVLIDEGRGMVLPSIEGDIDLDGTEEIAPADFEGIAQRGELPVYVRQAWEEKGLNLSDELIVLDFRRLYEDKIQGCLLYTSPSPRDQRGSRMPSSA